MTKTKQACGQLCAGGLIRSTAILAAIATMSLVGAGYAAAADDDSSPSWEIEGDLGGQYVEVSKSTSSFRQDHKMRSGGEVRLNGKLEWKDHRTLEIRGFGQSGEQQGYFVSDYNKLGEYGLIVEFSSWAESYNARSGRLPETNDGRPLAGNTFPGTNDGRFFFGGGSPETDWMNGGLVFDYQPDRFFSDVNLDLHVRRIDGEQTLAKTGAIYSGFTSGSFDLSGLIDFGFPSQKEVDYLSYLASVGTESSTGNANWQMNYSYANHNLESATTEVNYFANPDGTIPTDFSPDTTISEAEIYKEDTKLHIGKIDLAVARHIRPNLYVYGAGNFMYEQANPSPEQAVVRTNQASRTTRRTNGGRVTRFSPVVSLGSVFQPMSAVVVRLDTSFKYSMQHGRITEDRDESTVQPGDLGTARNRVDRDNYLARVNLSIDGRLAPRTRLTLTARYRYRNEIVDSRRTLNFIGRTDEREQFASKRQRIDVGPTLKYRLRRGRSFEAGYRYLYDVFSVDNNQFDPDELENQFVLNNFNLSQHKLFAKLRGRIDKNLRGEFRFEYVNEQREMERPLVETDDFADISGVGEVERESWQLFSSLYYQPHKDWNLNASLAIRQLKMQFVNEGPQPPEDELVDFQYNALTETLILGATYRPTDQWSSGFSYSLFNNNKSVDNMGHSARLNGDYRLSDTWRLYGNYRFYLYRRDGTGIDDYDAHVISLGVNAQF
jgi:hypothetical protein